MTGRLDGRLIGLGVCGSIAAYKAPELVRLLQAEGAEVQVLVTPSATRFVAPLTLAALSGRAVETRRPGAAARRPDRPHRHRRQRRRARRRPGDRAVARRDGRRAGGRPDHRRRAGDQRPGRRRAGDGRRDVRPPGDPARTSSGCAIVRLRDRPAGGRSARLGPGRRRPARRARRRSSTRWSRPSAAGRSARRTPPTARRGSRRRPATATSPAATS